jgi:hypothetical protein
MTGWRILNVQRRPHDHFDLSRGQVVVVAVAAVRSGEAIENVPAYSIRERRIDGRSFVVVAVVVVVVVVPEYSRLWSKKLSASTDASCYSWKNETATFPVSSLVEDVRRTFPPGCNP